MPLPAAAALLREFLGWIEDSEPSDDPVATFLAERRKPKHGTANQYLRGGCRCEQCAEAARIYHQEARARRYAIGLPPGDPRHGTNSAYVTWGCKCLPCCDAHAAYERSRYYARKAATP